MHEHGRAYVGSSEEYLGRLFFFHHVGPGDRTLVIRLGSKLIYPWSHLARSHCLTFYPDGDSLFLELMPSHGPDCRDD